MRLNSWTGIEGPPVSSLNSDRPLHSECLSCNDCGMSILKGDSHVCHAGLLDAPQVAMTLLGLVLDSCCMLDVVCTRPGETEESRLGTINVCTRPHSTQYMPVPGHCSATLI